MGRDRHMTEHGFSSLREWVQQFIKHKDVFDRKITAIDDSKDVIVVKRKDNTAQRWVVSDQFSYSGASKEQTAIACLSSRENIKAVVKVWPQLVKDAMLSIYFVNLKNGNKWNISPRVHDLIADTSTLESGLVSLLDASEGIVKEEPRKKKKQSLFEETAKATSSEDEEGKE